MDRNNINNPHHPLNVAVDGIKIRIIIRYRRLDRLMARLRPLIRRLQPDQLNDPMTPELILLREMERDEVYIVDVYGKACIFGLNRRQLHAQGRSATIVQSFIGGIDLIDNLLQISLTEIVRLEQQQ